MRGEGKKMCDSGSPHQSRVSTHRTPSVNIKDEMGLDLYEPHYAADDVDAFTPEPSRLDCVVPWELREGTGKNVHALHFLSTKHFWKCVENATRTAIVGILPAAAVLHSTYNDGKGPWTSQYLLVLGAYIAIAGKETIGLQLAYVGEMLRSSIIWVSIASAATALKLYEHTAAWFVVYGVSLFIMAALLEDYSRRVGMLLFTIAIMDMLRFRSSDPRRPFDLWTEWALGAGFGFMGALLTWPALSSNEADACLDSIASNLSTALQGLAASFWTDTNLTRNVRMVRVRFILHSIEANFGVAKQHLIGAEHEWMLQRSDRRRLRLLKMELYVKLFRKLSSIRRVVEIVRDRPSILSHSERATLFGERLGKRMDAICVAVDELLFRVRRANNHHDLLATAACFDNLAAKEKLLQDEFDATRREFLYAAKADQLEAFIPLVTCYVFCMSQICASLLHVREAVDHEIHVRDRSSLSQHVTSFVYFAAQYLVEPLRKTVVKVHNFFVRRRADDIRTLVEAAKVSFAMVASLAFYYYTDEATAFLSGPGVIAFIAASHPAEAVVYSVPRLSGTLIGVVIGFFIASKSDNAESRVAGLIALTFFSRLVSHVKNIGAALSYSAFIAISQVAVVPLTQSATMSRIQQATFAVFIYVGVTLAVFPCRPTVLLREARSEAIVRIAKAYRCSMRIFLDSAELYTKMHEDADAVQEQQCPRGGGNDHYFVGVRPASPLVINAGPQGAIHQEQQQREPFEYTHPSTMSFATSMDGVTDYPREMLDDIESQLEVIDKCLARAQAQMPFVGDEPRMSLTPYPTRACQDTQTALHKIVALARIMTLCMRLLRHRHGPPSHEVTALLRNIAPCARDTVMEFQRFAMLVALLIQDQRLDLGPEAAKSSQAFKHMCAAFHQRKSLIILSVIERTVAGALTAGDNAFPSQQSLKSSLINMAESQIPLQATEVQPSTEANGFENELDASSVASSTSLADHLDETSTQLAELMPTVVRPSMRSALLTRDSTAPQQYRGIARPASRNPEQNTAGEGDASVHDMIGSSAAPAAATGGGGRKKSGSILESRVELPQTFTTPISTQDAECIYTLSFALVMMSTELRKLLVAVEDSLQHRHN
jgi:hypothetical protein